MKFKTFIICGTPLAKQSARFAKRGKFMCSYQPKEIINWVAQARSQLLTQRDGWIMIQDEVHIANIKFVFPTLSSMSKKTKLSISNCNIVYKNTKPDIDNLLKNLWDSCNGILWVDDSKIVEIGCIKKIYGLEPRIELEVYYESD